MTTVEDRNTVTAVSGQPSPHPLDPLTEQELHAARDVLVAAGRVGGTTRFPQVMPVEPDKAVLAAGEPVDRAVAYVVLDVATGATAEAVVSVARGEVVSWTDLDPARHPYGQAQYLSEEYGRAETIVKASQEWQAAMRRRGLDDAMEHALCAPLAPGYFDRPEEVGRRVMRSLTFLRDDAQDNPWAHPVEGLIVNVDLVTSEVISCTDEGDVPVPAASGLYGAGDNGPERTTLLPIEITQPEGASFTVTGSEVEWQGWRFRIGFNAREGLVINTVTLHDGQRERSVMHRGSIAEMVVPYGDTTPTRDWISYFDAGEYLLGKNANSLALGCDCVGLIHYVDAVVADDLGAPVTIPQAVCLHEEDAGVLWKHTEPDGRSEVRRARRLVVSFFATVGNYDYGFYWYFGLDGSIEVEAKATGIVFAGATVPGQVHAHAPEIAPGIIAPVHQHLFCARLDMAVDGQRGTVHEVDAVPVPMGDDNPHGNAFTWSATPLERESVAQRRACADVARLWEVRSEDTLNAVGHLTAYQLLPKPSATLMAQPGSTVHARATFATQHLWVTAFDPAERFPAGDYPNAHAGGAGLPAWTAADRDLVGADVVLWHVFGPTHVPRPEDWPVMPVDRSGFLLRAHGFLDRNPALDLPDSSGACGVDGCATDDAGPAAHEGGSSPVAAAPGAGETAHGTTGGGR